MRILSTGLIGIGTTTPGTLLSVHGSAVVNGPLTAFGEIRGAYFNATSSTLASTFPIASSTSFSIADLLTVSGLGTSTFSGSLLAGTTGGAFGIGTSSPGDFAASIAGRVLSGATGATSTNIGAEDIRQHLRVSSLEILGSCKGCPGGGGGV